MLVGHDREDHEDAVLRINEPKFYNPGLSSCIWRLICR
jgi:hypothetical protein